MSRIVVSQFEKGRLNSAIFFLSLFATAVGICISASLMGMLLEIFAIKNFFYNTMFLIAFFILSFIFLVAGWLTCPSRSFRYGMAIGAALSYWAIVFFALNNFREVVFGLNNYRELPIVAMLISLPVMCFVGLKTLIFLPDLFKKNDAKGTLYRRFKTAYWIMKQSLLWLIIVTIGLIVSGLQNMFHTTLPFPTDLAIAVFKICSITLYISCCALCGLSYYLLKKIES